MKFIDAVFRKLLGVGVRAIEVESEKPSKKRSRR